MLIPSGRPKTVRQPAEIRRQDPLSQQFIEHDVVRIFAPTALFGSSTSNAYVWAVTGDRRRVFKISL